MRDSCGKGRACGLHRSSACLFFLPTLETALWWVPIIVGLVFRDAMVKVAVSRCKRELGPAMEELGVGRVS